MFNLGELFLFALSAQLFTYFFIFFWAGGVGEREPDAGMRRRSEKRAPQVIILHTPVMWGSDGVPPLCSTINSLGGSVERRRGGDGRGDGETRWVRTFGH